MAVDPDNPNYVRIVWLIPHSRERLAQLRGYIAANDRGRALQAVGSLLLDTGEMTDKYRWLSGKHPELADWLRWWLNGLVNRW